MRFLFMNFARLNVRIYIVAVIIYAIRTAKSTILASKRH